MTASPRGAAGVQRVERFKPTTGLFTGYAGLAVVAVGLGYVAFRVHSLTGLQVGLGLAFGGVVIWLTQLRPRAAVYSDQLLLKNSLVDHRVPLHLVDAVTATRTLNVWVGERRYVCIGIGQSLRTMMKARRQTTMLGFSRVHDYGESLRRAHPDQSAMSYETFVAIRIQELADQARRASHPAAPGQVVRLIAWPETGALAATGLAFVVALLL